MNITSILYLIKVLKALYNRTSMKILNILKAVDNNGMSLDNSSKLSGAQNFH